MKRMIAALAAGLMMAQIGCAASPGDWADAAESQWTLVEINGKKPLGERTPTLTLANDGRAAGRSGGNRFFGTYEQSSTGEIQFAALGSTKMFIDEPPGLMTQEQQYLTALAEVDTYRVRPGRLVLLSSGKKRLVFEMQ